MKISFTLNGTEITIDVAPDRRVVDLLREDLGLTGTKECCRAGECGSCTILIDGESRLSCLMLAIQLSGHYVTTIEGFSKDRNFQIIQRAFVESGAVQCGFCTPGMVLAVVDLLRRKPYAKRKEVREAISGNLCRCTGYRKIEDAVEFAIRSMKECEIN